MINKIKDIPNGTEVWAKMRRIFCVIDGYLGDRWSKVNFKGTLKILPEKGDLINGNEVAYSEINIFTRSKSGCISLTKSYRYPPKKIQKTLAELEKELGLEEGTLEITN